MAIIYSAAHPKMGKPAHNAKPVETEIGWLSPVKKSVGDPRFWSLRCRCGTIVIRELNNVRKSASMGLVPRCAKGCKYSEQR